MTVAVYKLDADGYRMKSHKEITRVTKIVEENETLFIHTYWSEKRYEEPHIVDLNTHGVDIYAGRN